MSHLLRDGFEYEPTLIFQDNRPTATGRTARPNSPAWIWPQKLNRDCKSFVGNLAVDSQFGKILFTTEARRAQRKMRMNLARAATGMASVGPKEMAVQRQGTGSPRRSVARAARFLRRHLRGGSAIRASVASRSRATQPHRDQSTSTLRRTSARSTPTRKCWSSGVRFR